MIRYLLLRNLDFVIRASFTPTLREYIKKYKLEYLKDGTGVELKHRTVFKARNKSEKDVELKLVIVKRGQELVPLVLPTYSELTPEQALLIYEERFGIETAYREVYNYLPKTCSLSPMYRLALYALTCWFFNILLNYYQIVVIFSSNMADWETSLARVKRHIDQILGEMLSQVSSM